LTASRNPSLCPRTLQGDDELHLPDILGEFRVPVRRFFE
jgi:hypothetical protein